MPLMRVLNDFVDPKLLRFGESLKQFGPKYTGRDNKSIYHSIARNCE
jgi:hypothetical protein